MSIPGRIREATEINPILILIKIISTKRLSQRERSRLTEENRRLFRPQTRQPISTQRLCILLKGGVGASSSYSLLPLGVHPSQQDHQDPSSPASKVFFSHFFTDFQQFQNLWIFTGRLRPLPEVLAAPVFLLILVIHLSLWDPVR